MKITREQLKNIVSEVMTEESEYQTFFKKALEKTGKSIPQMSDEEKKAFFNKIDAAWKGKGEKKNEGNAFGAAVAKAKKDGDDSFKVDGKEYKVESVNEDKRTDSVKRRLNKIIPRLVNKELKAAYRPLVDVTVSVEELIDVIEYDKRRDFKNTPKQQVELYKKADSIVKPLNAALKAVKAISMMDLEKSLKTESTDESVIEEGASTEEKRIAMLAVRKQAKYRSVDLATAIRDQIRALEELEREAKKGKLK